MKKILGAIGLSALLAASVYAFQVSAVSLPSGPALFETSLQDRISSTDTSMTLVANSLRGGGALSGYNCFTIDEGRTDAEFVCGTVSGTSVTSLERGIDALTGTSSVASIKYAHRKGANVKITDYPLIQRLRNQANGVETYPNALTFTDIAKYSSALAFTTQSNQLASVKFAEDYANNVIAGGAATSTELLGGKSELATLAEQASTFDGGAAKPTVLQSKYSTSTCQVVGSYNIVASTTTGKLDKNCFDQTLRYSFTAASSTDFGFTGGVTLNNLGYTFKTAARAASSTVLSEDGSGGLSFVVPSAQALNISSATGLTTSNTSTTTLATYKIAANTLTTKTRLKVNAEFAYQSQVCNGGISFGNGAATTTVGYTFSGTFIGAIDLTIVATSSSSGYAVSKGQNFLNIDNQGTLSYMHEKAIGLPYDFTGATYLSFDAAVTSGGTCALAGKSVVLFTNN